MLKEGTTVQGRPRLVFAMFYALGTVTFVPHNFYITANDYWMYKFRDTNATHNSSETPEKTELQTNFTSLYTTVSHVSMIVLLFLTIVIQTRISLQKRIVGSIVTQLILFIITLIFVWINTDSWQHGFFVFSLVIASLLNGAGACLLVSLFELSRRFPPVYLAGVLSGQAICGILAALVQIFSLAIQASSKINDFVYFSIGAVFVLVIEVLYVLMLTREKYFQSQLKIDPTEDVKKARIDRSRIAAVARKVAVLLVAMIFAQGITVMIHPGVTALVESSGTGGTAWNEVFFVPVSTYFLFNAMDFAGRELSRRWRKPSETYVILSAATLRIIFVPIIMFCNVQPRNHLSVVFGEDYAYIIVMIIFSFSNGYLINLCVVKVPSICEPDEMDVATSLILLVVVVTLATCSFISGLLIKMI